MIEGQCAHEVSTSEDSEYYVHRDEICSGSGIMGSAPFPREKYSKLQIQYQSDDALKSISVGFFGDSKWHEESDQRW